MINYKNMFNIRTPDYDRGFGDGFESAKYKIEAELKRVYKESKKEGLKFTKLLKGIKIRNESLFTATSSTHTHKCNCEFCELN